MSVQTHLSLAKRTRAPGRPGEGLERWRSLEEAEGTSWSVSLMLSQLASQRDHRV